MLHDIQAHELKRLYDAVAVAAGVDGKELAGSCRKRELVNARSAYSHLAINGTQYPRWKTVISVGKTLQRDPSTVLHHVRRAENLLGRTYPNPDMLALQGIISAVRRA